MDFWLIFVVCILLLPVLVVVAIALGPAALVLIFIAGFAMVTWLFQWWRLRHGHGPRV